MTNPNPDQPVAINQQAARLISQGQLTQARTLLLNLLKNHPDFTPAHLNLTAIYFKKHQLQSAKKHITRALELDPNYPEAHYNLGNIYKSQGQLQLAASAYRQALSLNPNLGIALNNLGNVYLSLSKYHQAIKTYRSLQKLDPHNPVTHFNLGLSYEQLGRLSPAFDHYHSSLGINPDLYQAHFRLGILHFNQDRLDQALIHFNRCLEKNPRHALAHVSLGVLYEKLDHVDLAFTSYQQALRLESNLVNAVPPLYGLARRLCNWPVAARQAQHADLTTSVALSHHQLPIEPPFTNLIRTDDIKLNFQVALAWGRHLAKKTPPANYRPSTSPKSSLIRLGYLSNDYRNHPIGHQVVDLFSAHDRRLFQVHAFSYGRDDQSYWRRRIEASADTFHDLYGMGFAAIAQKIAATRCDILIDLAGYTGTAIPEILVSRPAPLQVNYLGYPGTSGSPAVDYLIADPVVIPPKDTRYYTEKIIYLPTTYQINSRYPVPTRSFTRKDVGLPSDVLVFCSFNRSLKIESHLFDTWLSILKTVPQSLLWLLNDSATATQNLKAYARSHGIPSKRLRFSPDLPLGDHLGRLQLADIALDTHTYSGGATTANALWAGLPVITLQGRHYLSRMSSSLLNAAGLTNLITQSHQEYHDVALRLATHPRHLQRLKSQISHLKTHPLFDPIHFTRHLENAYTRIWQQYNSGKPPIHLSI